MKRSRAAIEGGYVRKTLSLPSVLVYSIEAVLRRGETISMFMTAAAERELERKERKI